MFRPFTAMAVSHGVLKQKFLRANSVKALMAILPDIQKSKYMYMYMHSLVLPYAITDISYNLQGHVQCPWDAMKAAKYSCVGHITLHITLH